MQAWRRISRTGRARLADATARDRGRAVVGVRRRRVVTALTVLIGATVLGMSVRLDAESPLFYPATLGLAVVWTVGAVMSGPVSMGPIRSDERFRRPILVPVLVGSALAAIFVVGGVVVRALPWITDQVDQALLHARPGPTIALIAVTAVNGIAEELFFRGAVYDAVREHRPVLVSTLIYTATVLAAGNFALGFAALLLGLVTGLLRRAYGGVIAPMLTHVIWSGCLLFALPWAFPVP
ncbi:type II CAAX prenyl endopeptidase Rce1 family protein [Nocardia brasiliensis]|uniref:CPBP family glutamic-type intramembrane protease n=1 Tax=Nocardia brasiliensis TaxID=37326 RepID=UPI003671A782